MSITSPTFCALPFGHLFLSEEGKSFPCCYALEPGAVNRDESGEAISVKSPADLSLAWNSPSQRKVRKSLLAGEKPAACKRCFGLESHGLMSLREISNRSFGQEAARAAAQMQPDGSLPLELFSVDLRLGNFCNLRCQMCSPVSSRKLAEDFRLLYPDSQEDFRRQAAIDWHKNNSLLSGLLNSAEGLREAHFAGGEPFLIPEVATLVERLAQRQDAKEISLSFNTNATYLPEKLLALFPRFKSVRLIVSLDGMGEVNDYIRFPSKFREIEKNLSRIREKQKEWNLTYVCFNITVQIHNIFHVPALINYLAENYPTFFPFPVLGALNVPECLSVKVLPPSVKAEARRKIEEFIQSGRSVWDEWERRAPDRGAEKFLREVRGLIDFMDSEDRTDLLPEFHRFSAVIEGIRGQKLAVPGL